MIYIFDDDQYNAVSNIYGCDFLFEKSGHPMLKYYKYEKEIDITVEMLMPDDVVCFHNSFPCDETFFIQKAQNKNEELKSFTMICFSGDSSFYNLFVEDKFIKIHKDKFYHNLKQYIDSNFDLNSLLYGDFGHRKEISIICNRINAIIFQYSKDHPLPISEIQPRDMKRLCELTGINYFDFLRSVQDQTVEKFKSFLNIIIQNK